VVWCGVVWCGVVWCGVVWCVGCEVRRGNNLLVNRAFHRDPLQRGLMMELIDLLDVPWVMPAKKKMQVSRLKKRRSRSYQLRSIREED